MFPSCLSMAIDRSDWWQMTAPVALTPIWTQYWQREGTHFIARMKYASSSCSQSFYRRYWFRSSSRTLQKIYYLHCGTEGRSSQVAKQSPKENVDLFFVVQISSLKAISWVWGVAAETSRKIWLQDVISTKYKRPTLLWWGNVYEMGRGYRTNWDNKYRPHRGRNASVKGIPQ